MKRTALIAIPVLAIVLVVAMLLVNSKTTLQVSGPLSNNARFAHPVSTTIYDYFNGSAFAEFNTGSGTSKLLTDIYNLPNITDIRWSQTGAVFKAGGYSQADQLYPVLAALSLKTDEAYWWIADFKTKKISLVGTPQSHYQVQDITWSGSSVVYAEAITNPDVDTQQILSLSSGSSQTIGSAKRLSQIFWSDGKTLIYQSTDDARTILRKQLSDSTVTTLVKDASPSVYVSPTGKNIIYINASINGQEGNSSPSGELKLFNNLSKTTTINKRFSGQVLWDGDRWLALARQADGSLEGEWLSSKGGQKNLSFKGPDKTFLNASGFKDDQILLLGPGNAAYIASSKRVVSKSKAANLSSIQQSIYEDHFYSTYDKPTDTYTVYILKSPYGANVQKVLQYFSQNGNDPYQLNIKWYAYDNVPLGS